MKSGETLDKFIRNFILKERRERVAFELRNERKRATFTQKLNHSWDTVFNMELLTEVPSSSTDDYEFVKEELKMKDDDVCYLISNHTDVDGRTMGFKAAFNIVYGRGFGSLVIAISGDRFYLETEAVYGWQRRFVSKLK